MHSNWKIWDLLKSRPHILEEDSHKLVAIQSFDPFAFKFIKKSIPTSLFANESLIVRAAKDVQPEWLEDNLKSLGLFGNTESYLILDAENLSRPCKEILAETEELILDERFLILDYKKEDDLLKKLKKNKDVESIKVQAPGFWEFDKLLDFLCEKQQVYLDISARELILQQVPNDIVHFYNLLQQIQINFPDHVSLNSEAIKEFILIVKTDPFELAGYFGVKNLKKFYSKLVQIKDFDELRQVFMFIQSHLYKIYDTEYTTKKNKLTKYDREVMAQSKIWQKSQLIKAINYFSELEIFAKQKNPLLFERLSRDHLRVII